MDGGGHDGNVSVFDKRRGGKGLANGLVDYHIETPDKIKSIFEGAGISTPSYNKLKLNNQQSIDTFKKAIAKAKQSLGDNGASVELKNDYTDINLYLSEDGESGFGVKPNGDIVSVFSSENVKGRSAYMLEMAIYEGGGRQLDCFDIYLTKIYETHGFKPVAKMKWDDEYIPEGWNKDNFKDYNNGEPALTAGRRHVVFMVYDPNNDIEKKKKEAEEKYGKKNEIPYIYDYDDGEDAQHMYKWRSPAEREAIYNNMLERYKNAKSTEELKKVFSNSDKPFLRQMDDLNSLSKEQAQSINAEYSKRYLELIKDENPEEYKKNKKYLEKKYNIKSDASIRLQRADAYIDSLIDTIEYIDAKKKEFKESDVNRDEDGKFATQNAGRRQKGTSSNKSNEETKAKLSEARRIKRYIENKFKTETMSNYEKDKWKEILKETIDEINEIKGIKTKDKKDNDKDNNKDKKDGLDYGDLPKELHEPFKRLNTTEKPSQYVFNNDNEYGLTIEDIIEISKSYDNVENVFCRINQFDFDITGEGDIEGIDLSNRDNLKSKIEKFLYDFTCNSDNAKSDWSEIYESTIKPQLKQMIKNSPIMKGKAYRVENWHRDREEIVEGGKINFDCRSVSDDNRGYETVCNFSQEDYEAGDDIYIFVFPEDTRGLNIQGCSVYPNQHEYLVDGDFIIKKVYKDEFDRTIVDLTKAE